jgi:hypothetical protein
MEKTSGISEIEKILTQLKEGKKEKECLQVIHCESNLCCVCHVHCILCVVFCVLCSFFVTLKCVPLCQSINTHAFTYIETHTSVYMRTPMCIHIYICL